MELNYFEFKNLVATASKDETKYHLNSIFLDSINFAVVSTDGHKLCKINCFQFVDETNPDDPKQEQKLLFGSFDKPILIEIPRVTVKRSESVKIYNDNGIIKLDVIKNFQVLNTVICKVIDLEYPDYNRVIPVIDNKDDNKTVNEVVINPNYLPVDCDKVVFKFGKDNLSPMIIVGLNKAFDCSRMTFVLMPMRA